MSTVSEYIPMAIGLLVYWIVGVVAVSVADRILSKKDSDLFSPSKNDHVGAVAFMAFVWPVAIVLFIGVGFREIARWIMRKVQDF